MQTIESVPRLAQGFTKFDKAMKGRSARDLKNLFFRFVEKLLDFLAFVISKFTDDICRFDKRTHHVFLLHCPRVVLGVPGRGNLVYKFGEVTSAADLFKEALFF